MITFNSQFDPLWRWKPLHPRALPNVPKINVNNFGCLLTCISMIVNSTPDVLLDKYPDCFNPDGNMKTDLLLTKLGLRMRKITLAEGEIIPLQAIPVIARTSYYSSKLRSGLPYVFSTHFYILLPDGQIADPASKPGSVGPKANIKYTPYTNELRVLERLQ